MDTPSSREPAENWYQRVVAEGIYLYDGSVEKPAYVIEQNYDYFHSMYREDGMLEHGETPKLNAEGKAYYLYFGDIASGPPYGVSKMIEGTSKENVMHWALKELPGFARWF